MRTLRWTAAALLTAVLTGCGLVSLPVTVDLKAHLGESAAGSFEEPIVAGASDRFDRRHPGEDGECFDLSGVEIPVNVNSARVSFDVAFGYEGPELSGLLSAQLYVSTDSSDLWSAGSELGDRVTIDLERGDGRLSGVTVLSGEQLRAINDRSLCWGLELRGEDLEASESGTATIDYRVDELTVQLGVALF